MIVLKRAVAVVVLILLAGCSSPVQEPTPRAPAHESASYALHLSAGNSSTTASLDLVLAHSEGNSMLEATIVRDDLVQDVSMQLLEGRWVVELEDEVRFGTPSNPFRIPESGPWNPITYDDLSPVLPVGVQWWLFGGRPQAHQENPVDVVASVQGHAWSLDAALPCQSSCLQGEPREILPDAMMHMEGRIDSMLPARFSYERPGRFSVEGERVSQDRAGNFVDVPFEWPAAAAVASACQGLPCQVSPEPHEAWRPGLDALHATAEWQEYRDEHPDAEMQLIAVAPGSREQEILGQPVLNETWIDWVIVYIDGSATQFRLRAQDGPTGRGEPTLIGVDQLQGYAASFPGLGPLESAVAWDEVAAHLAMVDEPRAFASWSFRSYGTTAPDPYLEHRIRYGTLNGGFTFSALSGDWIRHPK